MAIMVVVQSVMMMQRTCTIPVRIFVLRTTRIMTNTAGILKMILRSGIGEGSRVQAMMIVVQSVPMLRKMMVMSMGMAVIPRMVRFVGLVITLLTIPEIVPSKPVINFRDRPKPAGLSRNMMTIFSYGTHVPPMVEGGVPLIAISVPSTIILYADRRVKRCTREETFNVGICGV